MMSTIRSNGASDQTGVVDGTGSAVAEELERAGGAWAWAWSAGQNIYAPSSTVAAWARAWSEAQAIMSYTINGLPDALSASGIGTGANNSEAEDVGTASQGLQPGTASDSPFTNGSSTPAIAIAVATARVSQMWMMTVSLVTRRPGLRELTANRHNIYSR